MEQQYGDIELGYESFINVFDILESTLCKVEGVIDDKEYAEKVNKLGVHYANDMSARVIWAAFENHLFTGPNDFEFQENLIED